MWRFRLDRLFSMLMKCDESAHRLRELGPPPKDEAGRRQWFSSVLAESCWQRVTMPGVKPDARFDTINKAGGTAAMLSDNTKLAELAQAAEKLLEGVRQSQQKDPGDEKR